MNNTIVLVKTPRGREEVKTRAHGLSSMARRLLIIADGKHSAADLAAALGRDAGDSDVEDALASLLAERYLAVADDGYAGGTSHSAIRASISGT